jgi:hypothetical protein
VYFLQSQELFAQQSRVKATMETGIVWPGRGASTLATGIDEGRRQDRGGGRDHERAPMSTIVGPSTLKTNPFWPSREARPNILLTGRV